MLGFSLGARRGFRNRKLGVVFEAETVSYLSAMALQPSTARQGYINELVVSLKDAGVYSTLRGLYLLASHDAGTTQQAAKLNVIIPAQSLEKVGAGALTWATDLGLSGSSFTDYMRTPEDIGAVGRTFEKTAGVIGVYVNQQSGSSGSQSTLFGDDSKTRLVPSSTVADVVYTVNRGSGLGTASKGVAGRTGHFTARRTTTAIEDLFFNGASVGTGGGAHNTGTPGKLGIKGNDRVAAMYYGGLLTPSQVSDLHTALHLYLTRVGAQYS